MAEAEQRFELRSKDEILKYYGVSLEKGLSAQQVAEAQKKYGLNELEKEEKTPLWKLVLEQFDDSLVKILLGAATISFVLAYTDEASHEEGITAYVEPLVILIILILNAIVGVWQESNAEAALEALKELQPEHARVIRNGELQMLEAKEVVPGDIVEVRVGDKIPADIRLLTLHTTTMRIDQAQMTGESTSVMKDVDPLPAGTENVIQAKSNMLFATTTVTNGIGRGIVTRTGMSTEIGKIQASVQAAAEEEEDTPLKKKLDEFGENLSKVIGVICILVWIINYKNFFDPAHGSVFKGCIYYFKIAVALAVAAIPEGLPAVITTCLALGTRKMAKKNAIVRKLPSVETLGCTTVICSDKTGTLTTNEMCVTHFNLFGSTASELREFQVSGHSFSPKGEVTGLSGIKETDVGLIELSRIATICNEAAIQYDQGKFVRVGEPTEAALKVLVEKIGVPDPSSAAAKASGDESKLANLSSNYYNSKFKKIATLEFSRDRKSMSVLCSPPLPSRQTRNSNSSSNILFVKGAPESIIARSTHIKLWNGKVEPLSEATRKLILAKVTEFSGKALRCLAMAVKDAPGDLATYDGSRDHPAHAKLAQVENFAEIESNLTFVGLTAMLDPPRPEVRSAIDTCHKAGIRVIVITGDNKLTAESICRKIGVFTDDEELKHKSFTGGEFFKLSDSDQIKYLMEGGGGRVFSRTEPKHKQALVKMLKQQAQVVAMTGDGVNDAPALKQADIGIAMGITGTEVAKEASDMVLADDNFATIVAAVEEGRAIYNNMQAFIRYLISSNIGEVAAIFLTAALGIPEGLIPVQLLWVNLVTDGPPATALGFNPPDPDIMKKAPRRADDSLINGWVFFRYMVVGIYVGIACVGVFAYWYIFYPGTDGHTLVSWYQLSHWSECPTWIGFRVNDFDGHSFAKDPCTYFTDGKEKASTLSLSVLVMIEMLNAMNALSEDNSLLVMPPWKNPYLLLAIAASLGVHFVVLYVPFMADIFSLSPLDFGEWMLVLAFSFPVIIIDEVLKFFGRIRNNESGIREKKLK